jgi:hypothetical protein
MRRARLVKDGRIVGHVGFCGLLPTGSGDYLGIPDGLLSDPDLQALAEALDRGEVMRALAVLAGMLVGAFAGYLAGVYLACYLLWPPSNLCGLVGVFVTGPLGLVGGGIAGWLLSRRR